VRTAVLPLIFAAFLLAGCGSSTTTGSGHVASVSHAVGGFTSIDFKGAATIDVAVGGPGGVTIRGDDNIVPLIRTKVVDGVLVISSKHGYTTRNGLRIAVTTPALDGVTLDGAGTFTAAGIRATSFRLRLNGAGTVDLGGTVGRLDASVAGVGSALLEHLDARDARVTLAGAGTIHVNATRTLVASVSGVGSILYTGHPKLVHTHVAGVGSIAQG
jgi:hypothetical protein